MKEIKYSSQNVVSNVDGTSTPVTRDDSTVLFDTFTFEFILVVPTQGYNLLLVQLLILALLPSRKKYFTSGLIR